MLINKKISFKIMGLFLIVIIATGLVLSIYSYRTFEKNIRSNKIEILDNKLINLKSELSNQVEKVENLSINITALSGVKDYFEKGNKEVGQEELKSMGEQISDMSEGVFITNKEGKIVLDSQEGSLFDIDLSERAYFSKTMEGEVVWSDIVKSKATEELVLVYSRPYILNEKIEGIIGVTVKLKFLTNLVDAVKIGENGYAYMLDSNGLTLAHPVKEKVFNENLANTNITELKEQVNLMLDGKAGSGVYTYEGVTKLNNYDNINGFGIAVNVPEEEFLSLIDEMKRNMILITISVIIISLFITYFIVKKITNRIKEISKVSEILATGNIDVEINNNSKDEVGQLAESFSILVENIKNQANAVGKIADGDLDVEINANSEKDILNIKLIELKKKFKNVINDTGKNSDDIMEGALDARLDATKYKNDWKHLIENINSISDSLEGYLRRVPTTIATLDKEFNLKYMNDFGLNLTKKSLEEIKEHKCFELFNTGDCHTDKCACKNAMNQDIVVESSSKASMNGEVYDVDYSGTPIKNRNGEIVGAFEIVNDQTEIMNNQRLIEKRNEYQENEVLKLVKNLNELSNGNLDFKTEVEKFDSDTKNVAENFIEINENLDESTNVISGYIEEISEVLSQVANGNLDQEVNKDYRGDFSKIKVSLNTILDSMNEVMSEISIAADEVATGSNEVARSAEDLSQGSTEQASAVEQINSSINNIADQTRQNAKNSEEVNNKSNQVIISAEDGTKKMNEMIEAMDVINKSSKNIGKIIKVIDEIAFQTNILALNAAVEAERAGKYGKGFAVVAEEVRNLAGRSANAAKDTTELIEDSIEKISMGTKTAEKTGVALNEIVGGIKDVSEIIEEIAKASNEQAMAIEEINEGLQQVTDVTQSNTATAEESSAASEEMSSQAEILNEKVSQFILRRNLNSIGRKENRNEDFVETEISLEDGFGKY